MLPPLVMFSDARFSSAQREAAVRGYPRCEGNVTTAPDGWQRHILRSLLSWGVRAVG